MTESERRLLLAMARWIVGSHLAGYPKAVTDALRAVEAEAEKPNVNGTSPPAGEPSGAFDLEAAVLALPLGLFEPAAGDPYEHESHRNKRREDHRAMAAARLKERYAQHLKTCETRGVDGDSRRPRRHALDQSPGSDAEYWTG